MNPWENEILRIFPLIIIILGLILGCIVYWEAIRGRK